VAVKIIEQIADNIEEIEEEFLILRDLCLHPNIPSFYGIYLKKASRREDDQLWFVMEVTTGFCLVHVQLTKSLRRLVVQRRIGDRPGARTAPRRPNAQRGADRLHPA